MGAGGRQNYAQAAMQTLFGEQLRQLENQAAQPSKVNQELVEQYTPKSTSVGNTVQDVLKRYTEGTGAVPQSKDIASGLASLQEKISAERDKLPDLTVSTTSTRMVPQYEVQYYSPMQGFAGAPPPQPPWFETPYLIAALRMLVFRKYDLGNDKSNLNLERQIMTEAQQLSKQCNPRTGTKEGVENIKQLLEGFYDMFRLQESGMLDKIHEVTGIDTIGSLSDLQSATYAITSVTNASEGFEQMHWRGGALPLEPLGKVDGRLMVHHVVGEGHACLAVGGEERGGRDGAKGGREQLGEAVDGAEGGGEVFEPRRVHVVHLVEYDHVRRLHLLDKQLDDRRGAVGDVGHVGGHQCCESAVS